ncbi:hypothetical protein BMA10247_A1381 [Burkholderia mallei NCTC 10247]|nr:hypothetical protein BMA10247_A1381 [Burkholderia mallei NCTC 10247]EDU11275.1 hypothetical protein BURPS1655_I0925 [Burkholderia pseudomallei 1655]
MVHRPAQENIAHGDPDSRCARLRLARANRARRCRTPISHRRGDSH